MSTLEEVFAQGHAIARVRNPVRRAVQRDGRSALVAPEAVAGLAVSRTIDPAVLQGDVSPEAAAETGWEPDYAHCWCDACGETRRMQDTHFD